LILLLFLRRFADAHFSLPEHLVPAVSTLSTFPLLTLVLLVGAISVVLLMVVSEWGAYRRL
jgi:hypothetical protein